MLHLFASVALGQVNVETMLARADEPGLGGSSKGSLGLTGGNVETLAVSVGGEVHYITLQPDPPDDGFWFRDRVVIAGSYGRKTFGDDLADHTAFTHARYTRMLLPRVGADVYGQLQFDEFRLLNRRTLVGVGPRLDAVHRERAQIWLGTGYMAEWELRDVDPPDAAQVLNHRWNTVVSFSVVAVPERMTLLGTTYVQPRFDALDDVQVLSEWLLDVAVTDRFSIGPNLVLRYDSRPPGDLVPLDYSLTTAMALTL